ncbi:MAG TPA: hypothetical protein DCF68_00415, partial [Cyanothece sp. UBA12306]|nr:hypothetical protein [Cyanothece sp. UBA12306]
MSDYLSVLQEAVCFVVRHHPPKPQPQQLITALLEAEKNAKHSKLTYTSRQLAGTWQLCFITGTKKAQKRGGIILRSGRYIPRWAKIDLTYTPVIDDSSRTTGSLKNCIGLGQLKLILTGPSKFLTPKNILSFDFTKITLKLGNINLYTGSIRGGEKTEILFYEEGIQKQAFFSYFLIQDNLIAARGK